MYRRMSKIVDKVKLHTPNNIQLDVHYGTFALNIINNEAVARYHLDKAENCFRDKLHPSKVANNELFAFGDNSLKGIVVMESSDSDHSKIVHCNMPLCELFGYRPSQLMN